MKVAIIQEWLVTVGGSDKVVKAIADVFPNADIFTLVAKKEVCDELGIDWPMWMKLRHHPHSLQASALLFLRSLLSFVLTFLLPSVPHYFPLYLWMIFFPSYMTKYC